MMDIKKFIQFLLDRKLALMNQEKIAIGSAKHSISDQIQWIETILIFLNKEKGEMDMEKLGILLNEKMVTMDEIRSRQRKPKDTGLSKELIAIAEKLEPGKGYHLDTQTHKSKSLITKIYSLVKKGRLPAGISAMTAGPDVYLVKGK